ncbi:MAG: hypothetical protein ACJ75J_14050 [Cytophagaceae bacterium]
MNSLITITLLASALFLNSPKKKIKSITETQSDALNRITGILKKEFDETGFLVKQTSLTRDKKIEAYTIYIANEKGLVSGEGSYNAGGILTDTAFYLYNDKGDLVRQTRSFPQRGETYVEQFNIEYDAKGNVVKETQLDKDSVLDWEYFYQNNKAGQKIRLLTKFPGEIRNAYEYSYKDTFMTKMILFDYDNEKKQKKVNTTDIFIYDKQGRLIQKNVSSFHYGLGRMEKSEYVYKYDEHGMLLSLDNKVEGTLKTIRQYTYEYF